MSFKEQMIKSYRLHTPEQLDKIDRECVFLKKVGRIVPTYNHNGNYYYMDGNSARVYKNTIRNFLLVSRCIGKYRLSKYLIEIFGIILDEDIFDSILKELERDGVVHLTTVKKWSKWTKHIQKEFDIETSISQRANNRIVLGKVFYRKIKIENILKDEVGLD